MHAEKLGLACVKVAIIQAISLSCRLQWHILAERAKIFMVKTFQCTTKCKIDC